MIKISRKSNSSVKKPKVKIDIETRDEQNVLPIPTMDINAENKDPHHPIQDKAVTSAIHALMELIKLRKDKERQKSLFNDDPKEITLQVVPIKIPISHRQEIRISLPNPLASEGNDVCLITTDVKKATKNDHEPTIAYYKLLLEEKNIKGISEIIPIRQLRSEYVPYEMKGRFANLYDVYLVDGRLYGKVTKFLGSRFFKKNKDLIPVKINTNNVKRELEAALTKTVLTVHGKGDCFSVKVGYSHFSKQQLKDNLNAVAVVLARTFPGGFDNIRSLHIKCDRSVALPVFLSMKPANEVPVPLVMPKLPKAYQPVEGELSTMVGTRVTVLPTGQVRVKRAFTEEDVEMGYGTLRTPQTRVRPQVEEEMDDDDDGEEDMDVKPATAKGKKRKSAAADEDSSDDDVEAAEDAYVMGIQNQANAAGKAESKKGNATPKPQPGKAKKEATPSNTAVGVKKKNKLQRVNTGEERSTPGLKATPKVKSEEVKMEQQSEEEAEKIGFSPKKLKATPKVKPGKAKPKAQSEEKTEEMVSPKKLKATPKVKPGKAKPEAQSEEKTEEIVSAKKLKATPKVKPGKAKPEAQSEVKTEEMVSAKKLKATPKPGKARNDLEPEKAGLQEMIAQLLASKHDASRDTPGKSKTMKTALGEDSKSTPKTKLTDLDASRDTPLMSKKMKTALGEDSKSTPKTKLTDASIDTPVMSKKMKTALGEDSKSTPKMKLTDLDASRDTPLKSKKMKTALGEDSKSTPKTKQADLKRLASLPVKEPQDDDKAKSTPNTAVKVKKAKRLQEKSMSPVGKKTKQGSVDQDNSTPKALVRSPSKTKKQSKTKEEKKEEKSAKKSPVSTKDKGGRPARKSFPRYFSNENQKLLS